MQLSGIVLESALLWYEECMPCPKELSLDQTSSSPAFYYRLIPPVIKISPGLKSDDLNGQ